MAREIDHPPSTRTRTLLALAVVAWFAAACVAGILGLRDALLAFVVVPIAGFVAAYMLGASVRAFADRIPLTFLVGAHLWRFVGLGFLIGWAIGALPAGFAIPEGLGDIIAAAGALALVLQLRKGTARPGWLLARNIFGLLDLLSALTMGVLYAEGPLGLLAPGTVTTRWMLTFPISLIPSFLVPMFILFHLLTFKRIAAMSAEAIDTHALALDHDARMLKLSTATVRYVDIGEGEVVLLLHTVRTQLDYFEKVIPLLGDRYRVIALDLPGLGHSSIPRDASFDEPFFRRSVIELIEALDLRNLTIAGESIGGVLALTIAAERPDRVARVVSLNPYDYGEKFGGGLRRGRFGFIVALFELFRSRTIETPLALRLVLSGGFADPSKLPRPLLRELVRAGRRPGYRSAEYRVYKHWRSWLDAEQLYRNVKAPITLAYGARDWSSPEEREARRQSLHPQRYRVFEGVGHFSALENPEAVASLIRAA